MHAYIITRVHVNPYKYPATAAGYYTAGDKWREFDVKDILTFDIMPKVFTDYEQAYMWIQRNRIRTYNYAIQAVNVTMEVLADETKQEKRR